MPFSSTLRSSAMAALHRQPTARISTHTEECPSVLLEECPSVLTAPPAAHREWRLTRGPTPLRVRRLDPFHSRAGGSPVDADATTAVSPLDVATAVLGNPHRRNAGRSPCARRQRRFLRHRRRPCGDL